MKNIGVDISNLVFDPEFRTTLSFVAAELSSLARRVNKGLEAFNDSAEELVNIMIFANAAGALATTKLGAIPSLPAAEEVLTVVKRVWSRDSRFF